MNFGNDVLRIELMNKYPSYLDLCYSECIFDKWIDVQDYSTEEYMQWRSYCGTTDTLKVWLARRKCIMRLVRHLHRCFHEIFPRRDWCTKWIIGKTISCQKEINSFIDLVRRFELEEVSTFLDGLREIIRIRRWSCNEGLWSRIVSEQRKSQTQSFILSNFLYFLSFYFRKISSICYPLLLNYVFHYTFLICWNFSKILMLFYWSFHLILKMSDSPIVSVFYPRLANTRP